MAVSGRTYEIEVCPRCGSDDLHHGRSTCAECGLMCDAWRVAEVVPAPPRGAVDRDDLIERVATAISRSAANRPRKEGTIMRFRRYAEAAIDAMPDHPRGAVCHTSLSADSAPTNPANPRVLDEDQADG